LAPERTPFPFSVFVKGFAGVKAKVCTKMTPKGATKGATKEKAFYTKDMFTQQ
jgi:hypothetical protein